MYVRMADRRAVGVNIKTNLNRNLNLSFGKIGVSGDKIN